MRGATLKYKATDRPRPEAPLSLADRLARGMWTMARAEAFAAEEGARAMAWAMLGDEDMAAAAATRAAREAAYAIWLRAKVRALWKH